MIENKWHTGTPTEEGWYLVAGNAEAQYPYGVSQWSGDRWCGLGASNFFRKDIVKWQKIDLYKEKGDGIQTGL